MKLHIVCIDIQNDFILPGAPLCVPGAVEDAKRTAAMIERLTPKINEIHVTLDSHSIMDISHPQWWRDSNGKPPDPFTIITGAIHGWERKRLAIPNIVTKGSNPWTGHFSALRSEVPDPQDEGTQLNQALIRSFGKADIMGWTGQALNYCLANSFRDTMTAFSNSRALAEKMYILTDTTSNVPGPNEHLGDEFLKEMQALGVHLSTSVDFLS